MAVIPIPAEIEITLRCSHQIANQLSIIIIIIHVQQTLYAFFLDSRFASSLGFENWVVHENGEQDPPKPPYVRNHHFLFSLELAKPGPFL